jgi:peptide methionine sulfoxide reductase msrA/msrB
MNYTKKTKKWICIFLMAFITLGGKSMTDAKSLQVATFAGGCFWCMQPAFDSTKGVVITRVGYIGGHTNNPTYDDICTGKTGHAEAIEIQFDPQKVNYSQLLDIFWRNIDPTTLNQQFADRGTQYRTAIFYHSEEQKKQAEESKQSIEKSKKFSSPIVTEITKASVFYPAEDYHQKYYEKNVLHYNFYKVGSGRDAYLKRTWQK